MKVCRSHVDYGVAEVGGRKRWRATAVQDLAVTPGVQSARQRLGVRQSSGAFDPRAGDGEIIG